MQLQPNWPSELGDLSDPSRFTEPVALGGYAVDVLQQFLHDMLLIRHVEEVVGELADEGRARAPCHLGIGQEAVAVGVSASLRPTDRVFGGHRSHSHFVALGGDIYRMLAEVLGKADGTSRGMGGSMHLLGRDVGFHGSVPIVGATIPIAVGAGLAARLDGRQAVAVAYFGDGAAEEGVLHESLNLAAVLGLPVLFVCENNLFSSHLDIALRQPSDRIARFAEAHRIANRTVDGNDVVAVALAARDLVAQARDGKGPAFLEAVTYRHRGHVGPNEDVDVGVHRSLEELMAWKRRDPITRLSTAMIAQGMIDRDHSERTLDAIRTNVRVARERAEAAPYPPDSALRDFVYVRGAG
jgi:pyruvate dehydrogenase E1 component alpha subunit